jgi:hypothetical protein
MKQIPPDLVVKYQAIDIIGLICFLYRGKTSSKHPLDPGDRGLSRSHYPRATVLPQNPMECGISIRMGVLTLWFSTSVVVARWNFAPATNY